jgi:hypothetical protein
MIDMLYYKIKEILIRVFFLDSGEAWRVIFIVAGGVRTTGDVSRCLSPLTNIIKIV